MLVCFILSLVVAIIAIESYSYLQYVLYTQIILYIYILNLVLPEVHITAFNTTRSNGYIMESNSSFKVNCSLTANLSNEVEFLFRPKHSNITTMVYKTVATNKQGFLWFASFDRKASRENAGEYICRISGDVVNEASIFLEIVCMKYNFINDGNYFKVMW